VTRHIGPRPHPETADGVPARMRAGHRLVLLQGGRDFFPALATAMDAARQVIHLETYIFEFAGSALMVAEALERAAQRGVRVRLVIDGVGSPHMPAEWQQRFARAGVSWRIYSPLGQFGLLIPSRWRRLHRKLCVVDGTIGFCGGINIIDDQDDVSLGRLTAPRLDFSLQVSGPIVADMVETMEQLWWRLQAVRKVRQREFKAAWDALKVALPVGDFPGWWPGRSIGRNRPRTIPQVRRLPLMTRKPRSCCGTTSATVEISNGLISRRLAKRGMKS